MNMKSFLFVVLFFAASCASQHQVIKSPKTVTTPSGLQYIVLKAGNGVKVKAGDQILIFETATYRDGTLLYTNENSSNPIKILVGGHQATDGEDEGFRGMRQGEVRKMIIPPHLSKRKSYPQNLSPDSIIVVKVVLSGIVKD